MDKNYKLIQSRQKNVELDKTELYNLLNKNFSTCFIGIINICESRFGYLWGKNKNNDELTDEERKYKDLWIQTRTEILDHGNKLLRKSKNEIEKQSQFHS